MKKLLTNKKFLIFFAFGAISIFILYAWLLYLVIDYSNVSLTNYADAIVVLGHASPGGEPSPWLVERMKTGAYLYHSGYAPLVIVSGGTGPQDMVSVASIMFYHMANMGVSTENIIIEDRAANTYENFMYTYNIVNYHNINSMIVVTNGFHMYRSMMFGQLYFESLTPVTAGADSSFSLFLAYLREPISIVYNFIRYIIF